MTESAPPRETYSDWLKSLPAEERWNVAVTGGDMLTFWLVVICKESLQQEK